MCLLDLTHIGPYTTCKTYVVSVPVWEVSTHGNVLEARV